MNNNFSTKLTALIVPILTAMGFELWELKVLRQGAHSIIRVYIDSPTGINLEQCAAVSEQLGAIFDLENVMQHHYTLEISSPGLDRRLLTPAHYARYLNHDITIKLVQNLNNAKNYSGLLLAANDTEITIRTRQKNKEPIEITIPLNNIEKTNLVPNC